jgi:uncharacterized protein involved in exopolysaccharide biosynthesis
MSGVPPQENERLPEINLREIITPVFRQRRAAIWTFALVFALVLFVALVWAPNYYVATMQILVEQTRSDPAISAAQSAPAATRQVSLDQVNSEMVLLQGIDMMRLVVDACDLVDYKPSFRDHFRSGDAEQIRAVKREAGAVTLLKHLSVSVEAGSDLIQVKYGRSGSPEVPACVLQHLGQLYLDKHVQLQRPEGSSSFFTVEAENYRNLLTQAEQRVMKFSTDEGVAAPELIRTDLASQSATAEAQLGQARQVVATDLKRILNEQAQMAKIPARSPTTQTTLASNILLQNLQTDLLNAKVRRSQLILKYEPSYPLVKEVDSEIALTEASITAAQESRFSNSTTDADHVYEFLREDVAKTEADLATQQALVNALQISIASLHKEMVRMDTLAVEKGALDRDAKTAEGNYLLYQNKREQARISDELDKKGIANVAIAVPAVVPVLHAYPPSKILLYGFPLAILLALTAAYVAEYLDPSLRTPTEVSEALGIPVLAAIPR